MGCACAQIVRSLAGHDRGGLFCVLDTDGPYLLLCDGKRRKLENPVPVRVWNRSSGGLQS